MRGQHTRRHEPNNHAQVISPIDFKTCLPDQMLSNEYVEFMLMICLWNSLGTQITLHLAYFMFMWSREKYMLLIWLVLFCFISSLPARNGEHIDEHQANQ